MRKRTETNHRRPVPFSEPDDAMSFVHIPSGIFPSIKDGFIVTVDGNGMVNAGIQSGDHLILDTETDAQDGDIVVASANGQFLCRRIFFEGKQMRLRREDGTSPDVITDDCIIRGVLVGLMRNIRKKTAL